MVGRHQGLRRELRHRTDQRCLDADEWFVPCQDAFYLPAMTQPVYVAEPQAAASVAYVNPHDKDHDKHDKDKHDKDKHDKHDKHD